MATIAKPKAVAKKKPATPRVRKSAEPPRMKIVLAIYNQHLRRVASFDFDQQEEAEKKLKDLTKDGANFFMQRLKEPVEIIPEATEDAPSAKAKTAKTKKADAAEADSDSISDESDDADDVESAESDANMDAELETA